MIYAIRQVTEIDYASPVSFARHLLRMLPIDRAGQSVLSADLTVDPEPNERRDEADFYGNAVTRLAIDDPHERLVLTMRARIRVEERPPVDGGMTPGWERTRDLAFSLTDLSAGSAAHFLYPSANAPRSAAIRAYAQESFPPGRPVLAGAADLNRRIKADFAYDPEATEATTPAETAFAMRRGVCQDFAHVMIAGLRGLGLPAAYVSGFLRTDPPPGKARLEGADATHAWISVWCGKDLGWIDLDPTNGVFTGLDHVTVARGRDFSDVAPNDGVVVAAGRHTLKVAVDVRPEDDETLDESSLKHRSLPWRSSPAL